jgi:hypothetical protein
MKKKKKEHFFKMDSDIVNLCKGDKYCIKELLSELSKLSNPNRKNEKPVSDIPITTNGNEEYR